MPAAASISAPDIEEPAPDPADRRGPFRPERLAPVRERLSGPMLARLFRAVDVAAASVAVMIDVALGPASLLERPFGTILPLLTVQAVALWGLTALSAYRLSRHEGLGHHCVRVLVAVLAGLCAGLAAALLLGVSGQEVVALGAVDLAALTAVHLWAWASVRRWRRLGRLTPNIVVVGATPNASHLIETALATREVNVLGVFDDRAERVPPAINGVPVLGDTAALLDHKVLPFVDRVVITVTSSAQTRVRELIERLRVLPNTVTLFVDIDGHDTSDATLSRVSDAPLNPVSGVDGDERRVFWKRVQDLVIGSLALVAATPVMLVVAIAIRLDSRGPLIFKQRRHGFNDEVITVYKFRSLRAEAADHAAKRQVGKDDDRVTRVGRFIRRTSLDELPQLINVLRGEMSLVGPRPHPVGMITAGEESRRLVAEYSWRHRMKPGLTGWAQINGSRGPLGSQEDIRRRVVLDLEYIERQSFALDLYIVLMTLPRLFGDREVAR
jgi:Undecaprenyl-phosphate glucose phosphotransferase